MNSLRIHHTLLGLIAGTFLLGTNLQAGNNSPGVSLLATDPTALQGTSTGVFTLIRRGDSNTTLTVDVELSGTGANGVDYNTLGGEYTIPAGYLALDIPVEPLLNTANRGNKTVVMTVQSNAAYRVVGKGKATVKIVDDIFDIPPPTVALVGPADGSVYTSPNSITLTANVSDPDLPIQSVSFYANDTFLGRVTNSPYTVVWNNPRNGHFALFARATDQFDKSAVSEPVHITVSDTPVVTLTSDAENYLLGQLVSLEAQIGDANEKIQSVGFYVNNKLVGTATSAPFTFNWQTTKFGTFTVQAIATDKNSGKTGKSSKIQVNVISGGGA